MRRKPKHIVWLLEHSIWYRRALAPLVFIVYTVAALLAYGGRTLREVWQTLAHEVWRAWNDASGDYKTLAKIWIYGED